MYTAMQIRLRYIVGMQYTVGTLNFFFLTLPVRKLFYIIKIWKIKNLQNYYCYSL